MKTIIFHICLGMRGKNIWMSQFLYPKQWGRRELFSRRRRIRGLVPAAQEALTFGGGSAGHCGARTCLRWVHHGRRHRWAPCSRSWCCPQRGHALGQRDADLLEDPIFYHWVTRKSTLWSRSMLKTCPWVDKCRNTLLLGQLVEIRVGLAQPRRAGLCCTQLPQGCIPIVCKAKMAGKKSKKEYQPCAVGSCAAGPLFVASSAIRQRQGFAEVRYKKIWRIFLQHFFAFSW